MTDLQFIFIESSDTVTEKNDSTDAQGKSRSTLEINNRNQHWKTHFRTAPDLNTFLISNLTFHKLNIVELISDGDDTSEEMAVTDDKGKCLQNTNKQNQEFNFTVNFFENVMVVHQLLLGQTLQASRLC